MIEFEGSRTFFITLPPLPFIARGICSIRVAAGARTLVEKGGVKHPVTFDPTRVMSSHGSHRGGRAPSTRNKSGALPCFVSGGGAVVDSPPTRKPFRGCAPITHTMGSRRHAFSEMDLVCSYVNSIAAH